MEGFAYNGRKVPGSNRGGWNGESIEGIQEETKGKKE